MTKLPLTNWLTSFAAVALFTVSAVSFASDDHHHDEHDSDQHGHEEHNADEHGADEHGHDEHGAEIHVSDEMLALNGVTLALADGGVIRTEAHAYGRLNTPASKRAEMRARYAGEILDVRISRGQKVTKGDTLAIIEANTTLRSYALKAPFSGVIQDFDMSVGEVATSQVLVTLVDTRELVAELELFHSQREGVEVDMTVDLFDGDHHYPSTIQRILPTNIDTPHITALAPFDNHDEHHSPGDLVKATIAISETSVAVRVANQAIQSHDGGPVVFVKAGDNFEPRPIVIGLSDSHFTEVLSGLSINEQYVVNNSYLLKAEAEKSGAEHVH